MKIDESELIRRAEETARRILRAVPDLEVLPADRQGFQGDPCPDLIIDVRFASVRKRLILEAKTRGEPRLARAAVNQLLLYRERDKEVYGVFVAPYISPRAAEMCWAAGIGYLDLSGNCRLSFDGIFIEREGKPNKFAERRDLGTLYSPRATRIIRTLLCWPGRNWKVTELAQSADASLGLVSNVKKLLGEREWIEAAGRGLLLSRPSELLKEWSENYSLQRSERWDYYSLMTPAKVEAALAALCAQRDVQYALTAFSAAARMAPMVRYERAFVYVAGPVEDIAPALGLKSVPSGANVTLLSPYDAGVFAAGKEFDGIRTVSPVQAYLDLLQFKGRGEEAAAAILQGVIEPQW